MKQKKSIPIIAFGQAKPLLILKFQVLLCFQLYLAKRVTIDPILAKYSWQIEHFKYQTIETIKNCPYPCIDSVAQLTALRLNLFCFIIYFILYGQIFQTCWNWHVFGYQTKIMQPFPYFICIVIFLLLSTKL